MTTPNHDESKQLNEPELLEAEGFLNRGWRRLGEALGPFVAERTGNERFRGTRDIHAILNEMNRSWNTHFWTIGRDERDLGPRSWVNDLLSFRNGPWAHLIGYDDHDVLKCLYQMCQLLRAISADKQAQVVELMYDELGRLLFRDTEPTSGREGKELTESQQVIDMLPQMSVQQFFQLQAGISQILGQLEGGGLSRVPSLTVADSSAQVASVTGPTVNEDEASDAGSIDPAAADFLRMGNEDREAGFIEEAVAKYSRAIELHPHLVWAYLGRGAGIYGSRRL